MDEIFKKVKVIQEGYMRKDRVLRATKVAVGKLQSLPSEDADVS